MRRSMTWKKGVADEAHAHRRALADAQDVLVVASLGTANAAETKRYRSALHRERSLVAAAANDQ
jgi:hypothetical protein